MPRTPESHESSAAEAWHALGVSEVIGALSTAQHGLRETEVEQRLAHYGRNELHVESARSWWRVLLAQFASPVILLLIAASVISAVQQHFVDAVAIALVLVVNAGLGFWQQRRAERDVRALQALTDPVCRVRRDGREQRVDARRIVPGDIVLLESGERVPADLRLIEATAVQLDESMLTGESLAVVKQTEAVEETALAADRRSMAYSGTVALSGRGAGVVVATGARTEIGEINELVQSSGGVSPLQELTDSLERRIGLFVCVAAVCVFALGLLVGYSPGEMFRTAVALAVATIPESLPIILTVAMSVGVSRMARHNAVVRSLPAVETLGSTTVIASDKTGTLTQNRLTVEQLWSSFGMLDLSRESRERMTGQAKELLRAGALSNEATGACADGTDLTGDSVDIAMARVALETGAVTWTEFARQPLALTAYEPSLAYNQVVVATPTGRRLYMKGSPEAVLAASLSVETAHGPQPLDAQLVHAVNRQMGQQGLRVIAAAYRDLADDDPWPQSAEEALPRPSGLTFLGMQGMTDPPREGVAEAVAACHGAGIQVKMVTGDHPVTAMAIARRLGIRTDARALTGAEIASLSHEQLVDRVAQSNVIARATPSDKLRIVRALEDAGEVVAVTGDGVNDAPALKAAAIGVAMGRSGTEAAKEASKLVLTDDNFVTIVEAVRQGRVTFAAIRKATFFLLSTGVAALLAVTASIAFDLPLLFLPLQMLWINLVTNGVQYIALTLEPAEGDELRQPPRPRSEGVISRPLWGRLLTTGAWMAAVVLTIFWAGLNHGMSDEHARTLALTTFVFLNFFQVGNSRSYARSLFTVNPFGNRLLLATSVGALLLHWGMISWPVTAGLLQVTALSAGEWALALAAGSTVLVVVEAEKALLRLVRVRHRQRSVRAGS